MNKKESSLVNKDSAEIITGTIAELAKVIGVNPKTVSRWFQNGHSNDPKWDIYPQNGHHPTLKETKTDIKKPKRTLKTDIPISKQTPEPVKEALRYSQSDDGTPGKTEEPKIIIPSGKCVLCGRTIYHTKKFGEETVFVCFKKCQDIPRFSDRVSIPPSPEKLAYLREFIKANDKKLKLVEA